MAQYPRMPPPMMSPPMMQPMMQPMQPMMQPRQPSSDSSILILLIFFICIIFFVGGLFLYIQSEEEVIKETNCLVSSQSQCNLETKCSWDNELFMCTENMYDTRGSEIGGVGRCRAKTTDPPCLVNQRVQSNKCVSCRTDNAGELETRAAGDEPSGVDTVCFKQKCFENWHVENENCKRCSGLETRVAGDDPYLGNTYCQLSVCENNQKIECPTEEESAEDVLSRLLGTDLVDVPSSCDIDFDTWGGMCDLSTTNDEVKYYLVDRLVSYQMISLNHSLLILTRVVVMVIALVAQLEETVLGWSLANVLIVVHPSS